MLSLLKRYRELLLILALLVIPFAIFLSTAHIERPPNLVERGIIGVTSPLQSAVTWAIEGGKSFWQGYIWLRAVRHDNQVLKQENAQLRSEVETLREARTQNERMSRLLGYAQTFQVAPLSARVIGVSPDPNTHSIRIDKGEAQGVLRGMAVITHEGVAGAVHRTSDGYAEILLLRDARMKVGVRIQRTRSRALAAVEGSAAEGVLVLQYALKNEPLQEGDVVVTSGTDGVFPPGLMVGHLAHVSKEAPGPFQTAVIVPSVDASKLEEVLVIPSSTEPRAPSGLATVEKGLGAFP